MITIKSNVRQIAVFLENVAAQLIDFKPFWQQLIENRLRDQIMQVFASNGSGLWPPRRDNLPHPLLRKSYRLYNSLTGNTPDTIIQATAFKLVYGTTTPYAHFHEFGTSRIPARSFLLPLVGNTTFNSRLARDLDMYIQGTIRRVDRG